jgi:thiamine transport system ATP-binding protein
VLRVEGLVVEIDGRRILDDVSLAAERGETVAVLGPSGSGKTTLLRAIAGLQPVDAGSIEVAGEDVTRTPAHERGVGMMFQDYALFPHLDVGRNVEFGLRVRRTAAQDRRRRVDEVLEMVRLGGYQRRSISTLSGGERQRVALARALATAPSVLLLDEPLGALDRNLREQLLLDLQELFHDLDLAVVYVTHDQSEALALADRVVVMRDGRTVQTAPPQELWAQPADRFVARFLGFANVLTCEREGDQLRTPWGLVAAPAELAAPVVVVLVRPEAVVLGAGTTASSGPRAVVRAVSFRGDHTTVVVEDDEGHQLEASRSGQVPSVGSAVTVSLDPGGIVVLGSDIAPAP